MEESQKRIDQDNFDGTENKSQTQTHQQKMQVSGEFETYLLNALNDSLIKKSRSNNKSAFKTAHRVEMPNVCLFV